MSNHWFTPEEQFLKYHEKLRSELNNAYSHHEIAKCIRGLQKNYLAELNEASTFFALTMDAHLFATVMSINRFVDKPRDALKMDGFFRFIENNLNIFSNEAFENRLRKKGNYDEHWVKGHSAITSEMVSEDKKRLEKLPIKNLKAWRDKKLAHIDKGHVLTDTDIMQESPVTIQEIDKIINTIHGTLNRYLIAYDGTEWAIGLPPTENQVQYIANAIKFFRESKDKRSSMRP